MHRFVATVGLVGLVLVSPALAGSRVARADVTPPDVAACQGKSAGAECTLMSPESGTGACVKSTCSRLDYGAWDRDASPTPPTKQYECMKCEKGAAPASAPNSSGGGCSIAARTAGTWALALTPAIALALLERRRRRATR